MDALSDSGISRPFDRRRDGFVMGEGAGILVLEEEEAARARGARILGYLRGYASTSDAHHLTAPEPSGRGAAKAIELALKDADAVGRGHRCTSTPTAPPRRSTTAPRPTPSRPRSARSAPAQIPVSSTKSAIGHLLGAAGAVEAIATLLALRDRIAPPTLNYEEPDEGLDLDYVPQRGASARRTATRTRDRHLERIRIRRAQRRALPGGRMSALAERTNRSTVVSSEPRVRSTRYGRLEALCDPGSLHVIRSTVLPRRESKRMQPGDGVVGAAGTVAGRPVFCYAQDQSFAGGSLGEAHADTIVRVMELAERAAAPGDRLRRLRRRAHGRRRRGAGRLRAHLPRTTCGCPAASRRSP